MKIHPKPMVRHNAAPLTCNVRVLREIKNAMPVHIEFSQDGKTQRLIMTDGEALALASLLNSVSMKP